MNTIILAGGKSSRMGENKALMKVGGVRVIDRLIAEFTSVSEKIILIANEKLPCIDLPILEDEKSLKGQGPLAGIFTGLAAAEQDLCLVVACDMPFASRHLGAKLVKKLLENNRDAVIPVVDGQMHPLFAAYNARITEHVKETLSEGKRSVKVLLDRLDVEFIEIEEDKVALWNMNTKTDYIEAVKIAEGTGRDEL